MKRVWIAIVMAAIGGSMAEAKPVARSRVTVTDDRFNRNVIFLRGGREDAFMPRKGWACRVRETDGLTVLDCKGPSVVAPILRVSCRQNPTDRATMTIIDAKGKSEIVLSCTKAE